MKVAFQPPYVYTGAYSFNKTIWRCKIVSAIKDAKTAVINEIKDKLSRAKAVVLIDYRGLTVAEVTQLRNNCRKAAVDYKVYKNTMVSLAAKELGITGLDQYLEGPNAFAFSFSDVVAPAKVLNAFANSVKKTEIKAGLMENAVIDAKAVKALADLPSKETLIVNLMWALQGNTRKLAVALNAIKEQMEA